MCVYVNVNVNKKSQFTMHLIVHACCFLNAFCQLINHGFCLSISLTAVAKGLYSNLTTNLSERSPGFNAVTQTITEVYFFFNEASSLWVRLLFSWLCQSCHFIRLLKPSFELHVGSLLNSFSIVQ